MATKNSPTEKATEETMGIPHAYWEELLEEMDNLKPLYRKAKTLPPNERTQVHEALLNSLTHLLGHIQLDLRGAEESR